MKADLLVGETTTAKQFFEPVVHKTPQQRGIVLNDRDWSQVLAMATVAGISPQVISRAATRCSALFNESMAFQQMPERVADVAYPDPVTFQPSDFSAESAQTRLDEQPRTWDIKEGCPYPDCHLYKLQRTATKTMDHLRKLHHWHPLPWDLDAELTGMVGGVHVDGFLQPVELKTVGRDKYISKLTKKKMSDSRKRYMARRREERERAQEGQNKKQKTGAETSA